MNNTNIILSNIKKMLLNLGLREVEVINPHTGKGEVNYVKNNLYCIPTYIPSLGFLIEYANNFEEAQSGIHEDGDSFPLSLGEEAITDALRKEVVKNMDGDLWDFLEKAALDDVWVEVNTKSYGVFKNKSAFLDEAEDELGWTFTDARHENYGSIYFNDILSVKRLDTGEIFVQPQ